jgi:predicted transcriptional regulator
MGRHPGTKYTDTVALRLDRELRERLEKIAKAEERAVGAMARIILREGLENREKRQAEAEMSSKKGKSSAGEKRG